MTSIAPSTRPSSSSTPNETAICGATSKWLLRDAVPQAQELPQERFLDRAEQRHVRAILAAGPDGAEGNQQQFMQIMAGINLPRVNDLGKAGDKFFQDRASSLNPRLESSHASPSNPRLQPPAPYAIALALTPTPCASMS